MREAKFNLAYAMGGGVTMSEFPKMPKTDFLWMLKRMREQLKKENDEMKQNSKIPKKPSGKMKYLGR